GASEPPAPDVIPAGPVPSPDDGFRSNVPPGSDPAPSAPSGNGLVPVAAPNPLAPGAAPIPAPPTAPPPVPRPAPPPELCAKAPVASTRLIATAAILIDIGIPSSLVPLGERRGIAGGSSDSSERGFDPASERTRLGAAPSTPCFRAVNCRRSRGEAG